MEIEALLVAHVRCSESLLSFLNSEACFVAKASLAASRSFIRPVRFPSMELVLKQKIDRAIEEVDPSNERNTFYLSLHYPDSPAAPRFPGVAA